jgi:uncharacterized protein YjbI with pentapeptide repeats
MLARGVEAWNNWRGKLRAEARSSDDWWEARHQEWRASSEPQSVGDFSRWKERMALHAPHPMGSWHKLPDRRISEMRPVVLERADLNQLRHPRLCMPNADLEQADLRNANLEGARLSGANLSGADLSRATLYRARLERANLSQALLQGANLIDANLSGADLSGAVLELAIVHKANLSGANLETASLTAANLSFTNLCHADLSRADLSQTVMVRTNLTSATVTGARVYGISVWDVDKTELTQENLIITPSGKPDVIVDDLEVAQFVYMLLEHKKLGQILNSVMRRGVLLLGPFKDGGIERLQTIATFLREKSYLPIIFDFSRPPGRTIRETIKTLVGLSRFVIVDLSGPSVPAELEATVPHFKVPFVPILERGRHPYSMFTDLLENEWVLKPILEFSTEQELISELSSQVIGLAERRVDERLRMLNELFLKGSASARAG